VVAITLLLTRLALWRRMASLCRRTLNAPRSACLGVIVVLAGSLIPFSATVYGWGLCRGFRLDCGWDNARQSAFRRPEWRGFAPHAWPPCTYIPDLWIIAGKSHPGAFSACPAKVFHYDLRRRFTKEQFENNYQSRSVKNYALRQLDTWIGSMESA